MCGIGGYFAYNGKRLADEASILTYLSEAMSRRGPDSSGSWHSTDGRVHLVHRRLSIIDLTSAANQPLVDPDSGCSLVFNGEIYNYESLRADLSNLGHHFRTSSDTEVLLKGYTQWGEDLLDRLRGMYAFALWDPSKRALWLVRDPYGIKPLYLADQDGRLLFASQVRALQSSFRLSSQTDSAALVGLMLMGSVPEPYTIYKCIRALQAGHFLWVTDNGLGQPFCYASPVFTWKEAALNPQSLSSADFLTAIRTSVTSSVRAHRVADVPLGAFLSAGIDSGSLVGLLAMEHNGPLQTLTLGFNPSTNSLHDEVQLAKFIASRYGCLHTTSWISDADAADMFPTAIAAMDQPSVDGFNTWLVSSHAARIGLKVVFSGVGGDELFGGYGHFRTLPRWQRSLQRLSIFPGVLPMLSAGLQLCSGIGLVHIKSAALTRLGPSLPGLYMVRRGLFMPWELPYLLDADLVREGLAALRPPAYLQEIEPSTWCNSYTQIAALEAANYLRNQLLRDSDWASMDHSLELRTPLVDFQLLRELAPLLAGPRPHGMEGKRALALSPQLPLPDVLTNRPKSGFILPMGRWLESASVLDHWRNVPLLAHSQCHWSRRMAYGLAIQWMN